MNVLVLLGAIVTWVLLPLFFGSEWYRATGTLFRPLLGADAILAAGLAMRVIGALVIGLIAGICFTKSVKTRSALLVTAILCIQGLYFYFDWPQINSAARLWFGISLLIVPPLLVAGGVVLARRFSP